MGEMLPKHIAELYEMNLAMLEMTEKGEWEALIEQAAHYMVKKQNIMDDSVDELSVAERERLKTVLQQMINNEGRITRKLQNRLQTLKQNLSSIHRGTKASQLYSLQQVFTRH